MTIQDCLNCPLPTCDGRCKRRGGTKGKTWGQRYGGKTIRELSQESGVAIPTIRARLRMGWPLEEAIRPVTKCGWSIHRYRRSDCATNRS